MSPDQKSPKPTTSIARIDPTEDPSEWLAVYGNAYSEAEALDSLGEEIATASSDARRALTALQERTDEELPADDCRDALLVIAGRLLGLTAMAKRHADDFVDEVRAL